MLCAEAPNFFLLAQNGDTRMGETLAQMRRSCVKKGKGTATEDSIFVKRI